MYIGCKACAIAFHYGAPQFNHESGHISKCDGCYERLKEGKNPKEFAMVVAFIPSFFHLNDIIHIVNVLNRMGVFYANNEWHIGWMNNEILFISLVCALGFLLYLINFKLGRSILR
ncbi:4Fe-4S dicluster domain-containing protein [Campylobacter jejuni]|uniref:4Fe-4S dicluster domain-containing protein n=1 Tax=Campylobacter jejuni TaxID=197 RepID=UPI0009441080|nr:4Fe-4S dicluster domain-containing protein [Campylobacter jejuni]